MKDPEDAHHAWSRVLDAMNLLRRKVEAGPGPERDRVAVDVRESLALDDVADLVVGVAVIGRAAGLDDADELRRIHAARVLVDEIAEGALGVGTQLRPVGEADDYLPRRPVCLLDRNA